MLNGDNSPLLPCVKKCLASAPPGTCPKLFQPRVFELSDTIESTWVSVHNTGLDRHENPIHSSIRPFRFLVSTSTVCRKSLFHFLTATISENLWHKSQILAPAPFSCPKWTSGCHFLPPSVLRLFLFPMPVLLKCAFSKMIAQSF